MVNSIQDPLNPQRILVNWTALPCLQTNAPITSYVIQYGKYETNEVRTATTDKMNIKSSSSTRPTGLGFLDQGVVYYFRVAAQNANGLGPFSSDRLARTADEPTRESNSILSLDCIMCFLSDYRAT